MKMTEIGVVVVEKRHVTQNKALKRDIKINMPMVVARIVANSRKEKHVMKNAILKGGIVINMPMVITKIIANSRQERDASKKDAIVKRNAMKNMGSRGKIEKDVVIKIQAMKNIGSRGKTKILNDAIVRRHVIKKVG